MKYLLYYSYETEGHEELKEALLEGATKTAAMNRLMGMMGDNGYTHRSIDQVIPVTPEFLRWEREANLTTSNLLDRMGGKATQLFYTDEDKDFIFAHYSVRGPEYCALELGIKE